MNNLILYSTLTLSTLATLSAIILFVVANKFKVEEDPRIDEVTELLPGANCGGCGFPGCRGFAEAFVKGADNQDVYGLSCPPGGSDTMGAIASLLNMEVEQKEPTTAVLRCGGSYSVSKKKLNYDGPQSCAIVANACAGEKGCPFSCLSCGDCVNVCEFDAMYMEQETGLPVINPEKCVGCGACVKACPRMLIEIRPLGRRGRRVWVSCMNKEKGGEARKNCTVACIGCMMCVKACPDKVSAITVENNLAYIDPKKCIACGMCATACPTGAINASFTPPKPKIKTKKEESKSENI